MKAKVLINFRPPEGMPNFFADVYDLVPVEAAGGPDAWLRALRETGAPGAVVAMGFKVDAKLLAEVPPTLKVIATASVGYDHIDVAAAAARGIAVTNTPDVLTDATADMALLLLLGACRRAREYLHIMEEGWGKPLGFGGLLGTDLKGKTLGIYGMGRIGQAIALRGRAFGMRVAYHNRHRLPPELEEGAHYCATLEGLLSTTDVLVIAAPSTPATHHALHARTIGLLPKGAVLVNIARGNLVNEDDLVAALESGHLSAAGLDVFANEPHYDRRLAAFPRVFLTPHAASATVETRTAIARRAMENVARVLEGRPPRDAVFP